MWILLISLVDLRHFLLSSIELFDSNFLKFFWLACRVKTSQLYIIHRPINQITFALFQTAEKANIDAWSSNQVRMLFFFSHLSFFYLKNVNSTNKKNAIPFSEAVFFGMQQFSLIPANLKTYLCRSKSKSMKFLISIDSDFSKIIIQ